MAIECPECGSEEVCPPSHDEYRWGCWECGHVWGESAEEIRMAQEKKPMFRLEKEIHWEAAHRLPDHDGKCARLHGHSYRAVLVLESADLIADGPKRGMVRDYADVDFAAKPMLENWLDHHYLNETVGEYLTTSEELARWIYCYLSPLLPLLVAVRVHETCTTATEYRP